MHCPMQTPDILLAYVERTLAPGAALAFERHTESCASCRDALAAQQAVWTALDQWEAAEISPDFNRRLYQRIEADQRRAWWRRAVGGLFEPVLPWSMRPAMPLTAACIALLAVFLLQPPGDLEIKQAREPVDIEQVEQTLDDLEMLKQLGVAEAAEAL